MSFARVQLPDCTRFSDICSKDIKLVCAEWKRSLSTEFVGFIDGVSPIAESRVFVAHMFWAATRSWWI